MSSVLETFYILFKSDADDVDKGAKKASSSVDKLEKGLTGADKSSVSLGKNFSAVAGKALAVFAIMGAVAKLASATLDEAAGRSKLGLLADVLGESSSEIVNWGRAIQSVGGDSDAFQGSIRSLAGSLNDALIHGPNGATDALARMGVSARKSNGEMKTVLELLPDIAHEFETLTREAAHARGSALGLDASTIELLRRGEDGVRALVARQREMNLITDEETRKLRELNTQWQEVKNVLSDLTTQGLFNFMEGTKAAGRGIVELGEFLRLGALDALEFLSALGATERWQFVADGVELAEGAAADFVATLKVMLEVGKDLWAVFSKFAEGLIPSGDEVLNFVLGGLDAADEKYKELIEGDVSIGKKLLLQILGVSLSDINAAGAAAAGEKSSTVTIGEITVETQATDAEGIASGLISELGMQLRQAVDANDDGLLA